MKRSSFILCSLALASLTAEEPSITPSSTALPVMPITPAVQPVAHTADAVELSFDFIYWKTILNGLEYADSGVHDLVFVPAGASVGQGKLKNPKFEFEPGFKVGLDWFLGHDGWDLNFQYTWLNSNWMHNSIAAKPNSGVAAAIATVFSDGAWYDPYVSSATASLKQTFNVLDIDLGRNFFLSKYLTLKPHIGMKFGWIGTHFNIGYNTNALDAVDPDFRINLKQNMWGLGIRAGADSLWHFSKCWGLYGNIAFSSLYGFFHTDVTQLESSSTATIYTVDNKQHLQKLVNVLELGLGFSYKTWFSQDRYQYFLQAGWEEQIWMEFNNLPNIYQTLSGSLNLQGLTIKTGFVF